MITLESLLNNDNSSNDTISLEDYSFELSNYTMECSDIMCEINTLEAASIVCEGEENKKNIFKRMIDKIKELFERLIDFFKNMMYKIKQRKTDRIVDAIISKIKKNEQTQFIYTSNPYVDVLYKEKFDKNDIKNYVDNMGSFISNIQKHLKELESHITKNDDAKVIDDTFGKIKNDVDSISETLARSKFGNAIKKYREDWDEHYSDASNFYDRHGPRITDEKANRMSKDELLDRLSWLKTIYIEAIHDIGKVEDEVCGLKEKCRDLYKSFSNFDDSYLSLSFKGLQEVIEMISNMSLKINLLMYSITDEVKRISQII